jgi:hypothetical protein
MNHNGLKSTMEEMYSTLLLTHESKAHQTINHVQCLLYKTKAQDGTDILKHLNVLKTYCNCINKLPHPNFHVLDTRFKSIISASLPTSWQTFVETYNGNTNDLNDPDLKWCLTTDVHSLV